ncbi:hypothetical protein ABIE32_002904 [Comamonas sp. 4034]
MKHSEAITPRARRTLRTAAACQYGFRLKAAG